MSVTIDGPADLPALYRSADRESQRAQRSYLRSLRVRLGALLVAAFGGALTLTTANGFQVGGGLSHSLAPWAPSFFSPPQARSRRGTKDGPRRSRSRRSPGDTWSAPSLSRLTALTSTSSSLPRRTRCSRTFGQSRWRPESRMRTRSAARCAEFELSASMSAGGFISPTGLPTSNAGMPRRRGGTIAGRAGGSQHCA